MILSEEEIQNAHKIIGKNVARLRKQKGYSQLGLSLEMGHKSVSLVSFAEINLKGVHFNIEHLLLISKILDVKITEFFEGLDGLSD